MEKLVGSGNQGNFVHQSQTMAKDDGFRNVSKLWYDKTLSYDRGCELLTAAYDQREDILCKLDETQPIIAENGRLALAFADGREFFPNEYALRQLATRLNIPQTTVSFYFQDSLVKNDKKLYGFDHVDRAVLVNILKNGYRHYNDDSKLRNKKIRFRTYKHDHTMRAVLTEVYSPVDNRWYLDLLKHLIPGGRLSHWKGDADTIYGNILIPDTIREEEDSDYGGMLSISNCEIGKRRIGQSPSLFRAICMNGCIWDQTKGETLHRVHKGINLDELKVQIADNVHRQIPLAVSLIDKMMSMNAADFAFGQAKAPQIIVEIAHREKLNEHETVRVLDSWVKCEKQFRNLFGIINAITRAGQEFDNPDRWVDFDTLGGRLLKYDAKQWNSLTKRAAELTDDDVAEGLGVKNDKKSKATAM